MGKQLLGVKFIKVSLTVALLLLCLPAHIAGDEPVIALTVTPVFSYAPATVRYKITIQPHKDNFWYCFGYISDEATVGERLSCQQLNGIYGAKVYWHEYKQLLKGEYTAFARVYRVPNRIAGESTQQFRVIENVQGL